jgi:hypothetical protein
MLISYTCARARVKFHFQINFPPSFAATDSSGMLPELNEISVFADRRTSAPKVTFNFDGKV